MALLERLSPGVAAAVATTLFSMPRRHRRPDREAEILAVGRPVPIGLGSSRIEAWSWGEGPTVVLVHGWQGRGSQLHALVAPLVAAGFRVVAFDAPAHGDSPGRRTTLLHMARSLERVLAAAGPVHAVVAHSLGAAAATIALARGHHAERVVYLAPMSRVAGALERFGRFVGLGSAAAAAFRSCIERATGERIDAIEGARLARRLALPLLMVHDPGDREVPFADAEALAAAWSGARIQTAAGLGHRRLLRDPGVVAEVVGFVAEGRPRREPGLAAEIARELQSPSARRSVKDVTSGYAGALAIA